MKNGIGTQKKERREEVEEKKKEQKKNPPGARKVRENKGGVGLRRTRVTKVADNERQMEGVK